MSFVHKDTLVVCSLSSTRQRALMNWIFCPSWTQAARFIQIDHRREYSGISRPLLAMKLFIARGLTKLGDNEAPAVYVVVCQLLAFFRCLEEGLQPDSPSEEESSTGLWKAFLCTGLS